MAASEHVGAFERMPGDTEDYSAWVERLEPIAAQRVGWMNDRIADVVARLAAANATIEAQALVMAAQRMSIERVLISCLPSCSTMTGAECDCWLDQLQNLLTTPPTAAVEQAAAVLAAGDRMGRALDALVLGDATPAEAHATLSDYLSARLTLRGAGSGQ